MRSAPLADNDGGKAGAGCGPVAEPNTAALLPRLRRLGLDTAGLQRVFATFNVASPGFQKARDEAAASHPGEDARDRAARPVSGPRSC